MLYRRGKTWYCRFSIGGTEVRRSAGTTDKKKAEEFEQRLREDLWRQVKLGDRPDYTWEDACVAWLEDKATKRSADKDELIIKWTRLHLNGLPLSKITPEKLREIRNLKAKESSRSTANRYMALVRSILKHASIHGMLAKVPKVVMFPKEDGEVRWITREQFEDFVSRLRPLQGEIARFAVSTGLRRTNITHLEWPQIDFERRILTVAGVLTKNKKPLTIPLNGEALGVLERRKGKHERWVFARVKAAIPFLQTSTRRWREAAKDAALPEGFRFHDLRHTWASWHVQRGTPLHILQELGGWSSFQMVQRYAHLNVDHLADYVSAIEPDKTRHKADSSTTLSDVSA